MKIKEGYDTMIIELEEGDPYAGKKVFFQGEYSNKGFFAHKETMNWLAEDNKGDYLLNTINEEVKAVLIPHIKQNVKSSFIIDQEYIAEKQNKKEGPLLSRNTLMHNKINKKSLKKKGLTVSDNDRERT